jgi:hypothetical protein
MSQVADLQIAETAVSQEEKKSHGVIVQPGSTLSLLVDESLVV